MLKSSLIVGFLLTISGIASGQTWYVAGDIPITQTNCNGKLFTVSVVQNGNQIKGTADGNCVPPVRIANVTGNISGNTLYFEIVWTTHSTGAYSGEINDKGELVGGVTHDLKYPPSRSTWYTTRRFSKGLAKQDANAADKK
jgi:hypothetical protein